MPSDAWGIKPLWLVSLTLTACAGFINLVPSSQHAAAPNKVATVHSTKVAAIITQPPIITPQPLELAIPPGISQRFQVEQRSRTDEEALQDLNLVLHTVEVSADGLSLHLGFENTTDQTFSVIGHFDKDNVVLIDAAGQSYYPLWISQNLQKISPPDGFTPHEENAGDIHFVGLIGPGPYELRLSRFEPIKFRLDMPISDTVESIVDDP